ncbi:hypothetical protein AA0Y32_10785 [Georgenia phoenicis]|uniref:COG1470 family protein n=1 Tax=unclassified Georgenia TaxID=2626815 RepID=UPI0039B0F7FF
MRALAPALRPVAAALATVLAAVALVVVSATGSAAQASPAAEESTTTWTIQPAGADGPDGRLSMRHSVEPGGSVSDWVTVTNFGPGAANFRVYAGAGTIGETGAFDIRPDVEPALAVTLAPVEGSEQADDGSLTLRLGAAQSATLPLTIAAPDDVLPGDHPVGVVAELLPDAGSDVQLRSRVGVRAHLRVPGDITARVVAEDVRTQWVSGWNPAAPGTLRIEYDLHNTGNVRLGATSTIDLSGPFGLLPTTVTDTRREILPGQRLSVRTEVRHWGLVRSTGEVRVDVAPVGEDQVEAELEQSRTDLAAWTLPWTQLVLLLLLLLAAPGWRRYRLARARRIQHQIDEAVAAARADTHEDRGAVSTV